MDKFDDVLQKAKEMAGTAYKKTGEAIDIGKQRIEIASLNNKISNLYGLLGRAAIDSLSSSEDANIVSLIGEIKELEQKVEEIKQNILNLKGKITCPNCGKESDINTLFCSNCGTKLD